MTRKTKPAPRKTPRKLVTHEAFVRSVHAAVLKRAALEPKEREAIANVRLSYGAGSERGLRGVTWFKAWDCGCDASGARHGRKPKIVDFACIVATGQESVCQLIGTTLHELAHVAAGVGVGHGPEWKQACARVGLPAAVNGTEYTWASFDPEFVPTLKALPIPNDGRPRTLAEVIATLRGINAPLPPGLASGPLPAAPKIKPCGAGIGVRGGTSRGQGSGSRLLKHVCECKPPLIIRASRSDAQCTCKVCKADYKLVDASLPPAHGMGASGQGVPAATARKHGARKPLAKRKAGRAKAKAGVTLGPDGMLAPGTGATVGALRAAMGIKPTRKAKLARAKAAQAPLPEPPAEPEPAGYVDGVPVFAKPEPAWCETCGRLQGACGKPECTP